MGEGRMVAGPAEASGAVGPVFLCPAFRGLPARVADLAGTLPLADANAATLQTLRDWPAAERPARCYAGVLAVDPFWRRGDLIAELRGLAVAGVINLPSLGVLDGDLREAMAAMGFSFERELAFLQEAAAAGLRTAALVRSLAQARQAVDAGVASLVLHPGLPHGEHIADRQLVAACVTTVRRLADDLPAGVEVMVFQHPDFGSGIERAAAAAGGGIEYAVRSGQDA